jgi:hypothetical protein
MLSITIALDYTYDTGHFFDTQAKKDVLQLAASTLSSALNDTLLPIVPGGVNTWTAQFPNPSNTQTTQSIPNLVVPANTVIIYVGGAQLSGASEAGEGSTGGFTANGDSNWLNNILTARGKAGVLATPATAFGPWGGSIAFDSSGSTNWYFGTTTAGLTSNQTDFFSVAEHEIGHVLGIGTSDAWTNLVSAGTFHGTNAMATFGGPVPVSPAGDHWADGTRSDGGPAVMDPILTNGTRSVFTSLDFAGLKDIGWQVSVTPAVVQFSSSVYSTLENAGSVNVTVSRTGGVGPFSVNYATSDGSGHAGVDYQATSGVLNFAAGVTSQTITIPVLNNQAVHTTKTVNLTLSAPGGGAQLGTPATAVLNVVDVNATKAIGDFDSDGRSDFGVYRPSTSQWIIVQTTAGLLSPIPTFGAPNLSDIPVIGDFDGIGRSELGVFRPSTSQWFVLGPGGGRLLGTFGAPNLTDIPVPGDYDGVGHTELAVYRPSTSQWFVLGPGGGRLLGTFGAPNLKDIPVPGNWDGTGRTEPAVFRPSTSQWFALEPSNGVLLTTFGGSNYSDIPMEAPIGSLVRLGLTGNGGRPRAVRAVSVTGRETTATPGASATAAAEVLAPWVAPTDTNQHPTGALGAPRARQKNARTATVAWLEALDRLDDDGFGVRAPG